MKGFPSWLLVLAAALVSFIVLSTPGEAAKKAAKPAMPAYDLPMRVVIVRNVAADCEPLCPQWISAEGEITVKTPAVFKKALAKAKGLTLPIIVTSPGGDVDAALKIGEMIRTHGGDVVVGWTHFSGCAPHQTDCRLPKKQKGVYRGIVMSGRGFCLSACAFILAAGERRLMSPDILVGVHQISRTRIVSRKPMKTYVSTKLDRRFQKKLDAYCVRMGVDKALLGLFNKAPPSSMYMLNWFEARNTKLATDVTSAVDLIDSDRCKTAPPAANCVLIKNTHAAVKQ